MRLSQIQLVGFKSFADKLDIKFSNGITAIVGPNGCGKSNIVDAIRWVLGEQRVSTLRGDRMEDVIFNGTARRKPLGMAEVSLTIDNDKHLLPIEYSEVTLTRRLFRSGESEYLLNKMPCRLKDITDLLLDTGMGTHAYSMIDQGHVDAIVNGSPLERRHLIEEAAGINKYKTRRRLAERKLESTEHDLVRIADILEEVEKQAGALRRQVWKVERYKRLRQEKEELEIALAHHEFQTLRQQTEPVHAQVETLTQEKAALATKISTAETRIEKRQLELTEKERLLNAQQQEVNACDKQIQTLNEQVLVNRERRNGLEHRMHTAQEEIRTIRAELEHVHAQRTKAEQDGKTVAGELECARKTCQKREEAAQRFSKTLTEHRQQARFIQRRRLETVQRQTEKQGELNGLKTRLAELKERQTRLTETEATVAQRLKDLESQTKKAARTLKSVMQTLEENQALKAAIDEDLQAGQQQREETLTRKNTLDAHLAAKEREQGLLIQMQQQYEGFGQGVRALLADGPSIDGLHGTIAEHLTVDAPYAAAVEAYLGDALQYVISSTTDAARAGLEYLKTENRGAVSFVLLDRLTAHAGKKTSRFPADPDVIGPALDFVHVSKGLEPIVRYLLSPVILVRDVEAGLRLADRFDDGNGWRLLTPDGEMIDPAGVIAGGAATDSDTGLLNRTARLEALEQEIEEIQTERKTLTEALAALSSQLNTLMERRKATERVGAEQQQARQQAEHTVGQLEFQRNQLEEQRQRLIQERTVIETTIRETEDRIHTLAQTLAQLDQERQDTENTDRETHADLDRLEAEGQRLAQAAQEARVAMISLESRGNELRTTLAHLEQHAGRLTLTQQQRQKEIEDAAGKISTLQTLLDAGEAQLKALYEERRQKEIARDAVATQYRAIQEDIRAIQAAMQETHRGLDQVQEQIHAAELREAEMVMRSDEIRRHLIQQHDIDPDHLAEPPTVVGMEVFDPESAQGLMQDVQRKIDELGPINLAAIEEYNAIKERVDFLTQQRDDLIEAKTNLEKTIVKMNRAARARFLDTFEEVRQNFQHTFQALFEGGEADLRLEEGDPLEAGIDIMARPHGKRLQSIALLSGGETALTAIALLFAIYLVKPSPFCIFDEVDAPLDDANVRRFATALQHFAKDTQFLIVTHNKRTMEAANYLYGVTMEEPGLSKMVSVRLEGAASDGQETASDTNGSPRPTEKVAKK